MSDKTMPEVWLDRGLNDQWVRPEALRRVRPGLFELTLQEPLSRAWPDELVSYDLPAEVPPASAQVRFQGAAVPVQCAEGRLFFRVLNLQPGERRVYELKTSQGSDQTAAPGPDSTVTFQVTKAGAVFANARIALRLPAPVKHWRAGRPIPGPVAAVRRAGGRWLGAGRIECDSPLASIATRLVEAGPLWSTTEVCYRFAGGYHYRVRIRLQPDDECAEVLEDSTLPVTLWPAPRPYREIGSLGASHWKQSASDTAKPCTRPFPRSTFVFDLRAGLAADRLVTHSTGSWEIMDLPLQAPLLRTYTAMRPACPFIDGGWLGCYGSRRPELIGVASLDVTHWRLPDTAIHPAHRTPGANAEVLLLDGRKEGTELRFPIENVGRRWLFAVLDRTEHAGLGAFAKPRGASVRLDRDLRSPLWALRRRRGELALDKVKDWITAWPDRDEAHPRVLCGRRDFAAIRRTVRTVPECRANYAHTKQWRSADRYIMTGERTGLAAIEAATHARELIEGLVDGGYTGPTYAIGLARPLRRYLIACDLQWDSFTPAEKQDVRRVCALGGYILTDGDWWQYNFRPGETTYLPNFNSDVFACAGLMGLFLSDHPCSRLWTQAAVRRMDIELAVHLRQDGSGDENCGGYYFSTWTQLYMPFFWAFRHNGIKDYSRDPRLQAAGRFMLNVLAPPDPREDGKRWVPPIGHHPHARKAFPVMAWVAAFLRRRNPRLASELMWAWRAAGSPVGNLHDHSGPTANPFTRHYLFHDATIKPQAPALQSVVLADVGAVLRSHDNTGASSYVFLKAGRVHSHHDDDEGSFHYYGRGVPLALDGLRVANGAPSEEHNMVSFQGRSFITGRVEQFCRTPVADYVRAVLAPGDYCCDANNFEGTHHGGFERELVLVKAPRPGGVEYLVVKDTCMGSDACQWNLDVLSRKPERLAGGRVWFPGHPEFKMGLDVIVAASGGAGLQIEQGVVNPDLLTARKRAAIPEAHVRWRVVEHWLLHLPAPAGTTFVVVLFPRRAGEPAPRVEYLEREEILSVRHAQGRDLICLRRNPAVPVSVDGVSFQGRAGVMQERGGRQTVRALDAVLARRGDIRGPWRAVDG